MTTRVRISGAALRSVPSGFSATTWRSGAQRPEHDARTRPLVVIEDDPSSRVAAWAARAGSAFVAAHELRGFEHVAGERSLELAPPGTEADVEPGVERV